MFVAIIIASIYNRSNSQEQEVKQVLNRRALSGEGLGKILVVLPFLAARQFELLLGRAYIPQRLVILTTEPCHIRHKQVRALSVNLWGGPSVQRYQLLSQGYKNELYIFCANEDFLPRVNWDIILERSLLQAKSHLITQLCTDQKDKLEPTFPVLRPSAQTPIPEFSPRHFIIAGFLYPSPMLSTHCLFGSAQVMQQLLQFPIPCVTELEDDFILMNLAHLLQLRIHNPFQSVGYRLSLPRHPQYKHDLRQYADLLLGIFTQPDQYYEIKDEEEYPSILHFLETVKNREAYLDWLGYNYKTASLKGCRILGVGDAPTETEIVHKYGSVRYFREVRGRYCYD